MFLLSNLVIKNFREPQWSQDEKLCGRCVDNELLFYEDSKFDQPSVRVRDQKIANFAIAPGTAPYHVICYMPGIKFHLFFPVVLSFFFY